MTEPADPPRHLILVKHALPAIDAQVPAAGWPLSEEGREQCPVLARSLSPFAAGAALVSSEEPKAHETALLVGTALGLPVETRPGLHEHDGSGVPYLGDRAWRAAIDRFFAEPDRLVFGRETANEAATRFARVVDGLLAENLGRTLIVVAHGTVISLYVAAKTGLSAAGLWPHLGLPSFVVLDRPGMAINTIVERIGDGPAAEDIRAR
ncbi:MAG: phosphoglycerate mutase family protein [Chloroflexota bacterium]|nr:phosphoglycerate mutase family protein [Chloroflexota bacterium]